MARGVSGSLVTNGVGTPFKITSPNNLYSTHNLWLSRVKATGMFFWKRNQSMHGGRGERRMWIASRIPIRNVGHPYT